MATIITTTDDETGPSARLERTSQLSDTPYRPCPCHFDLRISATDNVLFVCGAAHLEALGQSILDQARAIRQAWEDEQQAKDQPELDAAEAERAAQSEEDAALVCGNQVQIDRSGVGHAWTNIDAEDIPASIREEIEGEMIDGGKDECDDFVASNGLHYRWALACALRKARK